MKQGRIRVLACVLAMLAAVAPTIAVAASKSAKTAASTATRRASIHQFSGWITAMDKTSLTVEKRGKNPRTMTFVRDDETLSSGELEKDARVTVYYRDVDGHATAHRVVAKSAGRASRAAKAANDD